MRVTAVKLPPGVVPVVTSTSSTQQSLWLVVLIAFMAILQTAHGDETYNIQQPSDLFQRDGEQLTLIDLLPEAFCVECAAIQRIVCYFLLRVWIRRVRVL